ncbi:MAG TPA: SUMF1/EgtB/PvdO family nonheme iron enzyme, partial [Lysobacter sp.]
LTAPADANAYTSVLEAWHADSTHPDVLAVIGELTAALADELVRNVRDGNDQRARDLFAQATSLGQQTGSADSKAQRGLREQASAALKARLERAIERYDRDDAQRVAQLANDFGLPSATTARFAEQAKAMPRSGETLPGGSVLRESKAGAFAISRKPVSRGDYARFARATGRASTLCRERASVLRVIAPRDWNSPGFSQGEGEPVVCVSLADAEAYAQWYSRQTGHRYRLPSATEARQTAPEISGRDVSLWLRDCSGSCRQHAVVGASWRSGDNQRSLSASRGHDDVGFRLVRDL